MSLMAALKDLHLKIFARYWGIIPGALILIVVHVSAIGMPQKISLAFVLSGFLLVGVAKALVPFTNSTVDSFTRVTAHAALMVALGIMLFFVAMFGIIAAGIFRGKPTGDHFDTTHFAAGIIITCIFLLFLLSRYWPWIVLSFLYSDVPRYMGDNKWYLGRNLRKPMLACKGAVIRGTLPSLFALVLIVFGYFAPLELLPGALRTTLFLIYYLYGIPICAGIMLKAGKYCADQINTPG